MDKPQEKQTKATVSVETSTDKTPNYPVVGASAGSDDSRRKKRGSSRTSRRLEDIEDRFSKSVHRVTKAVNRGVTTYLDKRDRSARKRRDGALVDLYENVATGVSETLADSAPVLTDFAKAVNRRKTRRQIKRFLRNIPLRNIPMIG
jgi:hypothetical protein